MRTLTATAILSLAVHGVALAWVIAKPKPQPVPEVTSPALETAPAEAELTFVELLPDPVAAAVPTRGAGTTVAPSGTRWRPAEISATGRTGTPPIETSPPITVVVPPVATPPAKRVLGMRDGPQVTSTAEQLVARAETMAPAAITDLPDYPGLRDRVSLENARARYKHGDMAALGDVVALEDAQAADELKPQKDGTWKTDRTTFVATVEKDGTVKLKDKRNLRVSGLTGSFDVTDWAMRSRGTDPYASAKLAYLDSTRDQRVEIGRAYRKDQLAKSDQMMNANLVRLWTTTQDVAAKKQGLLDLWDECAESGDAELVEGGKAARAMVERWMQVKLTGADRFTIAELAKFNAHRRSRATLDPYR